MKSVLWYVFFILLVAAACKKDDKCEEGDDLALVIVGRWDVKVFGLIAGEVEFKADGTLIDVNNVIIDGQSGGMDLEDKSYVVLSNSLLQVRAEDGGQSVEHNLDITSYSCDEIRTTIVGFEVVLDRK